jgi:hypothetical protein
MTSRRDARDDGRLVWPPPQDDLDALNVVALDGRPAAAAAYWRAPREERHGRSDRPVDAPPPPAPQVHRLAGPGVPLEQWPLLATGLVIGLALAMDIGLRPPATVGSATSPATHPAGGHMEYTVIAAVTAAPPAAAVHVPAGDTVSTATRTGTHRVTPPQSDPQSSQTANPPVGRRRDAPERRSPVTRAAVPPAPDAASTASVPEAGRPAATSARDGLIAQAAHRAEATRSGALRGAARARVSETAPDAAARAMPASAAAPAVRPSPAHALIRDVLRRYQAAYSRMDVAATRTVWPSVDAGALTRAFATLQEQSLALGACDIAVAQDHATAVCPGTVRYRPKVGNTAPQRRNGHWEVQLDRGAQGWAITGVAVR